jgi:hypothetical protein
VGQRVFRDQGGIGWVVVDVMPDTGNRRGGVDRRAALAPEVVIERRRSPERRVRVRPRVLLGSDLEGGWLYFQRDAAGTAGTAGVKRRLAPIPPGWEQLPEPELVALLGRARQVTRGGHGRSTRSSGEPPADQAELH